MEAPIIFCHYGDTEYLRYTLRCAKLNNPDKEVVLLGDRQNQWLGPACGVTHCLFDDFQYGDRLQTFERVYRLVAGPDYRAMTSGRDWVKFVFLRWFLIANFLNSKGIGAFWHFDSDTMIVEALARHEHKYQTYDCTEQCNGICLNGYVSGPEIVGRYLDLINDLFQREEYLQAQEQDYREHHPGYAFTEMLAYEVFQREADIRSLRLSTVIDGAAFDDCICQDHGMETEHLACGQTVKKVYLNPDGRFFCRDQNQGPFVQMNALNLSWVYVYVFAAVLEHSRKRLLGGPEVPPDVSQMSTLAACRVPLKYAVKSHLRRTRRFLKRLVRGRRYADAA